MKKNFDNNIKNQTNNINNNEIITERKKTIFDFKCPKCNLFTNIIDYYIKPPNSTLYFLYQCNNICKNTEIMSISLQSYLNHYFSNNNIENNNNNDNNKINILDLYCSNHPNSLTFNTNIFILNNINSQYICIHCFLNHFKTISNNIKKYHYIKYTISSIKPFFKKIYYDFKESECIRNIISFDLNTIVYLINQRIVIYDYFKKKILFYLTEDYYITDIIKINKNDDNSNLLFSYGTNMRIWNLNNIEQSKFPSMFVGMFVIVQIGICLFNKNIVCFNTEDGLFFWDYEKDKMECKISLRNFCFEFLFQINENIIVTANKDKIFIYFFDLTINEDNKNNNNKNNDKVIKLFLDDNEETFISGKELSDNRFIAICRPDIIKLYEIVDNNNNDEEEDDKFNYICNCIKKINFKLGQNYWNYFIYELYNQNIILFLDNNEIILYNLNTNNNEIIYKINGNDDNNNNREQHIINKVLFLGKNYIGFTLYNKTFNIFNIDTKNITLTYENNMYGNISTFNVLNNGDIAISQVKKEFFYTVVILK